jgi:hypothetical protein
MLFSSADLAEFLGPAGDFGATVQVGGNPISAAFFDGYAEALGMQGSAPVILCRSADVSAVAEGAAVVVPGFGNFTVATVKPDSQGFAIITLEASS